MSKTDVERQYRAMLTLTECFPDEMRRMAELSKPTIISKNNVFRPAKPPCREVIESMLRKFLLPGSRVSQFENIAQLYRYAQRGYSCLLLVEHYSNLDLPGLIHLLTKHSPLGETIGQHIIPMAAIKLNEEHPILSGFSDAYTHISIFPARRLDELSVAADSHSELKKAREINMAALKSMRTLAHNGNIILMFPSGTRYKPGDPQTKRVVRAAYSFMKRFDYVLFSGIAGELLIVNDLHDMLSDYVRKDKLVYSFSPVHKCKTFRKQVKARIGDDGDVGQGVIERIEEELEAMHRVSEQGYNEARETK